MPLKPTESDDLEDLFEEIFMYNEDGTLKESTKTASVHRPPCPLMDEINHLLGEGKRKKRKKKKKAMSGLGHLYPGVDTFSAGLAPMGASESVFMNSWGKLQKSAVEESPASSINNMMPRRQPVSDQ